MSEKKHTSGRLGIERTKAAMGRMGYRKRQAAQGDGDMTINKKAKLALDLIRRFVPHLTRIADWSAESPAPVELKLEGRMRILNALNDLFDEVAPDTEWCKDYYTLTGDHMQLTEYGWVPASENTREATGEEPAEILDEVNAPDSNASPSAEATNV